MMASFTDKPKIPLLVNSGSETFASLGTKKGSFESAYGTKFASRKVSEMPCAFDSEKDATSDKTSNPFKTVKLTWHESVSLNDKTWIDQCSDQEPDNPLSCGNDGPSKLSRGNARTPMPLETEVDLLSSSPAPLMCDGFPIDHFKMSSKLQRDFAAYFDKNQETECEDTLTDHTRDVRRAIALLKNPWMIIDIPRQLRETVQPSATVSSSVQTAPKLSDMDATQPLNPLAQHEKDILRATVCTFPQYDFDRNKRVTKTVVYEDNDLDILFPTRDDYFQSRTSSLMDSHGTIDDTTAFNAGSFSPEKPEPEVIEGPKCNVEVHGDGSIGNTFIKVYFKDAFDNGSAMAARSAMMKHADLPDMQHKEKIFENVIGPTQNEKAKISDTTAFDLFAISNSFAFIFPTSQAVGAPLFPDQEPLVYDGHFSSVGISDPNSKSGTFLGELPSNLTSHSNNTCPMDVSTIADAQKGSEPGCFATKIAPVGDSVGVNDTALYNAEDKLDMQQAFDSYNFDEVCNEATEELLSNVTVVSPDAIQMTAPPTTTTPVLTGEPFKICQNNPKRVKQEDGIFAVQLTVAGDVAQAILEGIFYQSRNADW